MTATATRYDFDQIIANYDRTVAPLHEEYLAILNQGGKMRGTVGKLYEDIAQGIIYAEDDQLVVKHNDYVLVESFPGSDTFMKVQVDLHVYKDNELLAIVECKTYLDRSMLDRACSESEKIREVYPGVPTAVFAGQFDVADNSFDWYNHRFQFETFVINQTYRRDSKAPVFKTCDPLNMEAMQSFAQWIQSLIDNF